MPNKGALFVSRAGADGPVAEQIGRVLEEDGYTVVLQQWNFANRNFVDGMDAVLRSDARVVALLSSDYLASEYCAAEWQSALAHDPLNRKGRLILLRVGVCAPQGLLAALAYWDLVPLRDEPATFEEVVKRAVDPSSHAAYPELAGIFRQAAPPLPSGTVTFLFMEIEESVAHWERDPIAMEAAVRRMNVLLNNAISERGGRFFRSSGESSAAVFELTESALLAAVGAQRGLCSEDFSEVGGIAVRMAIHTGPANVLADDYIGPAVNRAVRLLDAGHGGQILVSGTSAQLLGAGMAPGLSLRDLGEHRLKDLSQPERIFQAEGKGLPSDFATVRTVDVLPNNLPLQTTPLIGREGIVDEVRGLISQHRFVTLVGTGGIGKTRIALQVAADMLDGSGGGVWFVDLAPLTDSSLVASAVAATLGLRESQSVPVREIVLQFLRTQHMLLVLDNCEHVVADAATFAAEVVASCPSVSILATSRERLNIHAEQTYRVPPLSLPQVSTGLGTTTAMEFGAIAWFVARATLVNPRFTLNDANTRLVSEICSKLDGIPYAIELAAARVNVLTISELGRRIDHVLAVVSGGARDEPSHRQSLRAMIDWSHDLISPNEQALFRRMAIFSGGCSLAAAEAVCSDAALSKSEVLDLIDALVDKSLIVAELQDERESRYRFLETTRAYAHEKLVASGEDIACARKRALWVASFADQAYESSWKSPSPDWLGRLLPELENVRGALAWAYAEDEFDIAGRIAGGLIGLWQARGAGEGIRAIDGLLKRGTDKQPSATEALLWSGLSALSVTTKRIDAAERAGRIYEQLGDQSGLAQSLRLRAEGLRQKQNLKEAQSDACRALDLFHALGLEESVYYTALLQTYGIIQIDAGHSDAARALLERALTRLEEIGDEPAIASVKSQLAELEFSAGNVERALALAAESAEACSRRGDVVNQTVMLCNLAAYYLIRGDIEAARDTARQALDLALIVEIDLYTSFAVQHLGTVAALRGDAGRATALLGYVDRRFHQEEFERELTDQQTYDLGIAALKRTLSESEFEVAMAFGASLSDKAALDRAHQI